MFKESKSLLSVVALTAEKQQWNAYIKWYDRASRYEKLGYVYRYNMT